MRKTILAAGAAIAALSLPAFAQSHGHGGGGGAGGPPVSIPASPHANAQASGQVRGDVHAQTDTHASGRAQARTGASVDHSTQADVHARAATGAGTVVKPDTPNYGGNVCAPGLASRDPSCVPPGQADRTFRVGQHLSKKYQYYTDFGKIPQEARSLVPDQYTGPEYRYIYQSDRIYVVNRSTDTVATVVNLNG